MVGVGLEEGVAPARQVGEAGHLAVVERPAADLLVRQRQLVKTPISIQGKETFYFFSSRDNGLIHMWSIDMMDGYSEKVQVKVLSFILPSPLTSPSWRAWCWR